MEADILWGQNPSDPGPYKILGFDISGDVPLKGTAMSANIGDSFSFATGTKTFLDHRDAKGNVINISYTGSDKNLAQGEDLRASFIIKCSIELK